MDPAASVSVENPAALRGASRVAIGTFTVDILDRQEADAQIGGIELVTGAPSNIIVNLVGVERDRYQALAETAYRRFVGDLEAQGFKVIPQAELAANPEFQKVAKESEGAERLEKSPAGSNHYVSAQGLPIWLVDETLIFPKTEIHILGPKPKRDPYISWSSRFGVGFAQMGFERQRAVARSLGAPILNVRVTLLGGQARIDNAFWKTAGSARTDAAMTFVPLYNRVLVVGQSGPYSRLALSREVTTGRLGELVGTTGAADHTMQMAGNTVIAASRVMGAFMGGGAGLVGSMHYSNRSSFELRTDEATFEAALDRGFARVSQGLTQEMARAR